MPLTIADGQLAATSTEILGVSTSGSERHVNVLMRNTSASTTQTVVLTVSRDGGTARSLVRAVLAPHEPLHVLNIPLDPADVLAGSTTNATTVDYLVTTSQGGAFEVRSLDANGALKQVNSGISGNQTVSGNQTITGDLTVSGGDIDAGASGAAGTVDIFPATASTGKTQFTATANAGNTTTTITTAEQAGARTYTVPDAGGAASFVMTAGVNTMVGANVIDHAPTGLRVYDSNSSNVITIAAGDESNDRTVSLPVLGGNKTLALIDLAQTFTAIQTFSAGIVFPVVARTATADGLTTGTIADAGLLQHVTVTAGGDANAIIVLPTPTPGTIVIMRVGATGFELRTSSPTTIGLNGGTGADAESAIAAGTMVVAICTSATSWQAFSLVDTTLAAVEAAA